MKYELVAGLETHIELSTNTKIFCGCTTEFEGGPNTHCCPVCLGLPGALPVLNASVVEYGVRAGLALNCTINQASKMDRKNYFYPDLSKAYQTSQQDKPVCINGYIELQSGKKIRINRIHIEEDAGKLVHNRGDLYIDCNRASMPLIEIVTEPDFRSAEEIREYLETLQSIIRYTGVSNCRMQEGSMRCDVNISLRPFGQEEFGTRAEIKNMNSFTFIMKAVEAEYQRQADILDSGGRVLQETLRFDPDTGETSGMRGKEDAADYRYFRCPDLPGFVITDEEIEKIRASIPELGAARAKRYTEDFGISETDALNLTKYRAIAEFFESASDGIKNPKTAANFILTQIFSRMETEADKEAAAAGISPDSLRELILLLERNKISTNIAKRTLETMLDTGKAPGELLRPEDLEDLSESKLSEIIKSVIAANPGAVNDYLSGKEKALKSLLGGVMRETKGKANPIQTEEMIKEQLKMNG